MAQLVAVDQYTLGQELGRGSYGQVFKATLKKARPGLPHWVAIKCISTGNLSTGESLSPPTVPYPLVPYLL